MSDENSFKMTHPASHAFEVQPSDSEQLPEIPRALYIGTGGDLACRDEERRGGHAAGVRRFDRRDQGAPGEGNRDHR